MNVKMIFAFLAGVGVGVGATYSVVKQHFKEQKDFEIDEVREYYRKKYIPGYEGPESSVELPDPQIEEKPDIMEYAKRLKDTGYHTDYSAAGDAEERPKVTTAPADTPFVISPEEFGEMDGYTQISLTLYSDDVLADDGDFILKNEEEIVGEFRSHFGEYEDDTVFVRNDVRRCDYEIVKDVRRYADILDDKPYKAGM